MDYKTRQELNQLSKQVFGTSSKWQKLVNDGFPEAYGRDREVMIPRANGEFVKKIFTEKKSIIKRYTVDEVRKLMEDVLESRRANAEALAASLATPQTPEIKVEEFSKGFYPEGTTLKEEDLVD